MKLNQNYQALETNYLFSAIARKVKEYQASHPDANIIRMGIGDVTKPLAPIVVNAMKKAADEMQDEKTFHGYGEEQGYDFLRAAVAKYYAKKTVALEDHEIFISDGAKSDLGNLLDIFSKENTVLIPNPVYPVYVDTNIMDGRKIIFLNANKENNFLPMPDESITCDIIYLCSPNNPTGAVYTKEQLKTWVAYAKKQDAVILFDAAYESFISTPGLPTSIYEIEGAKECAIEVCSLSKTAGFTGTRCGYTIVPDALIRDGIKLQSLWLRRQTTKFNGVSYIIQRAAEAVFTEEGQQQTHESVTYYKENAKIIADTLRELNIWFCGGDNSPYLWLECKDGMSSWEFFDYLLENANIVGTPGAGFGDNGEGFFRLTAFGNRENIINGMERFKALY